MGPAAHLVQKPPFRKKVNGPDLSNAGNIRAKEPEDIKTKVKNLLAEGDLKSALEQLRNHFVAIGNEEEEMSCIHQLGLYHSVKKETEERTISRADRELTEARIASAAKSLLGKV